MMHTALINSDDKEGELLSLNDDDDDDDILWVDEPWLDGSNCVSLMSSLSTTNSFYGFKRIYTKYIIKYTTLNTLIQ